MSSRNPRDPMLPFGSDKCRCSACHEYFNSSSAFAKHRQGDYSGPQSRYCLTAEQMAAKGWSRNATGHWITAKKPAGTFTRDAGAAIALRGYCLAADVLAATAPVPHHNV